VRDEEAWTIPLVMACRRRADPEREALVSDDRRKLWRLVVQKGRESIEVGEGVVRPFEFY